MLLYVFCQRFCHVFFWLASWELLTHKLACETTQHKKHTGPPLCHQLWANVTTQWSFAFEPHLHCITFHPHVFFFYLNTSKSNRGYHVCYCRRQLSVILNRPHSRCSSFVILFYDTVSVLLELLYQYVVFFQGAFLNKRKRNLFFLSCLSEHLFVLMLLKS